TAHGSSMRWMSKRVVSSKYASSSTRSGSALVRFDAMGVFPDWLSGAVLVLLALPEPLGSRLRAGLAAPGLAAPEPCADPARARSADIPAVGAESVAELD